MQRPKSKTHLLGGGDSFTCSLHCTWPAAAWSTRTGLFTPKIQWQIRVLRAKVRNDARHDSQVPEIVHAATYLSASVQCEFSIWHARTTMWLGTESSWFPPSGPSLTLAALWRLTYERYVTCYVYLHNGTFLLYLFLCPKRYFYSFLVGIFFSSYSSSVPNAKFFWLASRSDGDRSFTVVWRAQL